MFLSCRRIPSCWITSLLLGLTLLFAFPVRAAQRFPKCCVWRVTNAKAPFYLVGSIHALNKKDYPLPRPYELALKDAGRLLFEFDPNRGLEFEKKLAAAGKYPPGQNIRSKIDPKLLFRRSTSNIIDGQNLRIGLRISIPAPVTSRGGSPSISSTREIPAICRLRMAWTITWCRVPGRWEKR